MALDAAKLGERLGSGDSEGWTLNTRQIAFEPLPASVLFGLGIGGDHGSTLLVDCCLNAIAVWIKNKSSR
jgi:hypothetical protein